MDIILCILSLTGKVGKSTIVNNLLAPRMPTAKIYRLETINLSGKTDSEIVELKGRDFVQLQNALSKDNSAIVDVGASNVESFLLSMTMQPGAHEDFDYFLIPIEASDKKHDAINEFINLVRTLHNQGIGPERIKVIFNKLEMNDDLTYQMRKIINFHKIEKEGNKGKEWFTLDLEAVIHDSPVFTALSEINKSFSEMLLDKKDYRSISKSLPADDPQRLQCTKMMRAQRSVIPMQQEFDTVFKVLFGE